MSNAEAAADLNALTRPRQYVSGSEILNATDDAEFGAIADPTQRDRWIMLCGIDSIDTSSGVAKELESALFGAGTQTRSNLVALKQNAMSRAAELGLTRVREGDVEYARTF